MESIRDLFESLREECSATDWSRGVELARRGSVVVANVSNGEVELRVAIEGSAVSPTVHLALDDGDWSCDCATTADTCAHVAAAVIHIKQRGLTPASTTPASPQQRTVARVGYQFIRTTEGLSFSRVLIAGTEVSLLKGSLLHIAQAVSSRTQVAPSKQDMAIELALGQKFASFVPSRQELQRLLLAMRGTSDVSLDGVSVTIDDPINLWRATLTDDNEGFRLHAVLQGEAGDELFTNGAVLRTGALHPVADPQLTAAEFQELKRGRVFSIAESARLVSQVLPALKAMLPLEIATERLPSGESEAPRIRIQTRRQGDSLVLKAELVYGTPAFARIQQGELQLLSRRARVPVRDHEEEQRLARRLERELGLRLDRAASLSGENAIAMADRLRQTRIFTVEGDAHSVFYRTDTLVARVGADAKAGVIFEVSSTVSTSSTTGRENDHAPVDTRAVLDAWQRGDSIMALSDGGFAPLPLDWLNRFGDRLLELIDAREASPDRKLPRASWLDLLRLCRELDAAPPLELCGLRALLQDFAGIPAAALPADLQADLRQYQREGVNWLVFMKQAELGALLADDMGLGKTLQAIAILDSPTLVVAPTSVLRNWANEIARFRPTLRVNIYHGPARSLDTAADVTLTTYAILRLDEQLLTAQPWRTIVLDEAQSIKNPQSQAAQAAYQLQANFRLALTGTPIENRLEDLWSLFRFIEPSLLGGRGDFNERYAEPIARGDANVAARLHERLRPFILRREKKTVARELPPRTEVVLRCELSREEKDLYEAVRSATRKDLVEQLGSGKNALAILEAILRLRQAACHPALLPGQEAATSAKVELLRDCLSQVIAADHKALVFSQWTSLLDLLEPHLRADGVSFLRLDGTTLNRQAVVDAFQKPDGPPVMLLSLKAGGVGLTLTEADHVFLLDPWWNPATEAQAADRAHRIGQTRPVLVCKLVATDTLEERVLELQDRKRALIDAALQGTTEATSLTREDLLALLD